MAEPTAEGEVAEPARPSSMGKKILVGVLFGVVVYAGMLLWLDGPQVLGELLARGEDLSADTIEALSANVTADEWMDPWLYWDAYYDMIEPWFDHGGFAARRGFLSAAKLQSVVAEIDRTVERRNQFWRKALHGRIGKLAQAVRYQLRTGEHVAQVMIDLGNSKAKIGQALALLQ